jgi:hypothetical protein
LVDHGDFYTVGNTEFLVAPVDDNLIEAIAAALGQAEDDEPNGDAEPSLGWTTGGSHLPHVLADGYRGGTTGEYAVDEEGEQDRSDYEPDHDNEPEWYLDG